MKLSSPLPHQPTRFRVGTTQSILLPLLVAAAFWGCPKPDCICVPVVKQVELRPEVVYVSPGDVFRLQARLFADDGREIPEFFGIRPQWEAVPDGALKVLEREGHGVVFEVGATVSGEVKVVAEAAPNVNATQTVLVIRESDGTRDFVRAEHIGGQLPNTVIVDEMTNWSTPAVVGFTHVAPVGTLVDPNPSDGRDGGLLLFAGGRETAFSSAQWTSSPSGDLADFRDTPSPTPPWAGHGTYATLDVALHIYVDPTAPSDSWDAITAAAITRIHVADATRIYAANRSGVSFSVADVRWLDSPVHDCSVPLPTSTSLSNSTDVQPIDPTQRNVFYVNMGGDTGFTCSDLTKPRILMSSRNPFPTTLAHELGHLLALDEMDDLGAENLMKQGDNDEPRLRRSRLSLGQICAMNWATASLLRNHPSRHPGTQVPGGCPPITLDP